MTHVSRTGRKLGNKPSGLGQCDPSSVISLKLTKNFYSVDAISVGLFGTQYRVILPVSHIVPLYPRSQLQRNALTRSVQLVVWLAWHGLLAHSSISITQTIQHQTHYIQYNNNIYYFRI